MTSSMANNMSSIITVEEACALNFADDQGKNYEKTEFKLHSRVAEVIGHQLGRVFYDDTTNEFTITPHEIQNMVLSNILEEGGSGKKSGLYSKYPIYGSAIAFEPGVFNSTEGLSDGVPYPAASHKCLWGDVQYCTSEAAEAKSLELMELNTNNNGESIYSPYAFRGPPDEPVYKNCSLAQPDFCPSMELSFAYDYSNVTVPEAEWYNAPRCLYLRDGETTGYWTSPYFDAGAGNINMVTYSQPIISQSGKFLGIATIDVTVEALCYGAQCVPEENSVVRWVGYSLGFIIIAIALFFGGWVVINRKHRVVRISQPIFLDIVILGVLILASAIFPLGVNETNASERGCNIACAITPWLISLGFSLIFAALFSKLWRINRVFQASSTMRRVVVSEKDVILPFAILMTVNFVILLSWTLVDPMVYQRVVTDNSETHGRCIPQGNQWKVFFSLLAILNFTALVIVNVQAYIARGISDELSESKYIGLATLSLLQIFIVGVPLLVIVHNDPSAYFFVWCGLIFVVCSSILLLIFGPKLLRWRSWNSSRTRQTPSNTYSSDWRQSQATTSQTADGAGLNGASDVEQGSEVSKNQNNDGRRKRVSFDHKSYEHKQSDKLEQLRKLIEEEHNIDVSPIILKLDDINEEDENK